MLREHLPSCEQSTDPLYAEIAIVGAGMAGLMTFVGRTVWIGIRDSFSNDSRSCVLI